MRNQYWLYSLAGLVLCIGCQGNDMQTPADHKVAMLGSWTTDHEDVLTIGPVRPESGRGEYKLKNSFAEKTHQYAIVEESAAYVQIRVFFADGGTEDRKYVVDLDGERLTEFLTLEGHAKSVWVAFHRHDEAHD